MAVYVDADACPVKDEAERVASRHGAKVYLVSNGGIRPSRNPLVEAVYVSEGPDEADKWIAERAGPGDVVVTNDIPLAARCVAGGARVLKPLATADFAERTLINVNFPPLAASAVKGIKVVRQGFHDYGRGTVVKGTDPRGFSYYWFGLHGIERTPGHDTDLEAISDGYISITPLQLDLTHKDSLAALSERYRQ